MALYWIVLLAAVIPMWLLQNIIHELSHGLAVFIGWGWRFSIWPFPSKRLGNFTFAHVLFFPTATSKDPGNAGWGTVAIMPKIVCGALMVATSLAACLLSGYPVAALLLCQLGLFSLVDFSTGIAGLLFGEPNSNDFWRFQEHTGTPVGSLKRRAVIFALTGLVIIAASVALVFIRML